MNSQDRFRKPYEAPETMITKFSIPAILDNPSANIPDNNDGVSAGSEDEVEVPAKGGAFSTVWDNQFTSWNDHLWK